MNPMSLFLYVGLGACALAGGAYALGHRTLSPDELSGRVASISIPEVRNDVKARVKSIARDGTAVTFDRYNIEEGAAYAAYNSKRVAAAQVNALK